MILPEWKIARRKILGPGRTLRDLIREEGWSEDSLRAVIHRYWGKSKRPRRGSKFEVILLRLEELVWQGLSDNLPAEGQYCGAGEPLGSGEEGHAM
jgi:hypothetical protein